MAPISSVNPSKRVRIPGLLDGNLMVLIYTPDYFESDNVTIVDFADDFVTLNRLHGMVVSRFDIEFYWSFGVRGASKHGDPRQEFLLGQVKSPLFEEYLASLDGTRNGQAFKKEIGNKETSKERTLSFRPNIDAAPNDREEETEQPEALLTEGSGEVKKKRRRRRRKNKVAIGNSGETSEQADAVFDPKVSPLHSDNEQFKDTMLSSQANSPITSPAELIDVVNGLEISDVD